MWWVKAWAIGAVVCMAIAVMSLFMDERGYALKFFLYSVSAMAMSFANMVEV